MNGVVRLIAHYSAIPAEASEDETVRLRNREQNDLHIHERGVR